MKYVSIHDCLHVYSACIPVCVTNRPTDILCTYIVYIHFYISTNACLLVYMWICVCMFICSQDVSVDMAMYLYCQCICMSVCVTVCVLKDLLLCIVDVSWRFSLATLYSCLCSIELITCTCVCIHDVWLMHLCLAYKWKWIRLLYTVLCAENNVLFLWQSCI